MLNNKEKSQNQPPTFSARWMCISIAVLLFLNTPAAADELDTKATIKNMYEQYRKEFAPLKEMSARKAIEHYLAGDDIVFIDVREPEERGVSTLPHALSVEDYLAADDAYEDHIILAYCTIGYRSGLFTKSSLDWGHL